MSEISSRHETDQQELESIARGEVDLADWHFVSAELIGGAVHFVARKSDVEIQIRCNHTEFFALMRLDGQEFCSDRGREVPVHAPLAIAARSTECVRSIKEKIKTFLAHF